MHDGHNKPTLTLATEAIPLKHNIHDQQQRTPEPYQNDSSVIEQHQALELLKQLSDRESSMTLKEQQLTKKLQDQLEHNLSQQSVIRALRDKLKQQFTTSKQLIKQLATQLIGLRSQLEQLKNIEKSITRKEQAIIIPSTDNHSL
ncbi:MAG: hypothetical protein L3J28_06200 [Candidatus Polarisedimenticolaceae bacterium]|nr:hypothetical protein [Candidatus Polarisedimenticolaceae bacterium]